MPCSHACTHSKNAPKGHLVTEFHTNFPKSLQLKGKQASKKEGVLPLAVPETTCVWTLEPAASSVCCVSAAAHQKEGVLPLAVLETTCVQTWEPAVSSVCCVSSAAHQPLMGRLYDRKPLFIEAHGCKAPLQDSLADSDLRSGAANAPGICRGKEWEC